MAIYEPSREAKTVLVRLKFVARTEVTYHVPDEKRLPRPRPNLEALPKLEAAKKSIGSQEWWDAWFEYLSKDKKDRDNIRDLILSKLPAKTLFRVGWVPSYRETMLNYSQNPFLQRHLRHKKNQYFLTTFCVREKEIKEETDEEKAKKLKEVEEAKPAEEEEENEDKAKTKDSARKSVKPDAKSGEQEVVIEETPEFDSYLEGVDLEDAWVQLELTQGEQYVKLRGLQIRGENDNYQKLEKNPYVEVKGWETKKEDMGFGTAYLGYNVVSLKELLRKVQAYDPIKKKWITMPSLNFLPPKVNGMLAGEGGLLLLSGDIRPYVDPNAPKVEEKLKEGDGDAKDEKKKSGDEPRKSSLKSGDDKKKASVTLEEPPAEGGEGEEGAKQDESEETKKIKKKKEKPAKKVVEPYKPPEFPPQHLLVVVNPVTRAFRVLPPMHVNLENLVARLIVHSTSGSYTAYVVGFHRRIKECIEFEGMRVAVYKSCKQQWSIHFVPSCRIFLPGQCTYSRALPLLTKLCEGPTLFMSGQLVTNVAGVYNPVVLGYRLRTRTWKSYHWPPLSVTEAPHVLEVNNELYIIARGAAEPATIHIWRFTQYVYEVPDCKQVTMMPQDMFSKCFCTGFRKAAFDCVSSMNCIAIVSREVATIICLYDVKANKWLEPMERYPGFVRDQTFLGNWSYEPTPYALV